MEARKDKLKHKWVRRFEVMPEATGDNWVVCKRCGMPQNDANKDKPCREAKKPKA